jgi:recombination protein RecT
MNTQVATRERNEAVALRDQLTKMGDQFKAALPTHITPEKFARVAMTAINRNGDLLKADRKSLLEACLLAAQDGLLPDGRQAALVMFGSRVQYMPMVAGIRMKVYQSGEITSLVARIAYEGDIFEVVYGDDERIIHKPNLFDRGRMIAAYAIATYKDGAKAREVMSIDDIEKVRSVSRAGKGGPWGDWYEEMAKKTVIRRLAKSLPLSAELDDFMRRDDDMYDLGRQEAGTARQLRPQPQTIEARLDQFAAHDELPAPASEPPAAVDAEEPAPVASTGAEGTDAANPIDEPSAQSAPPSTHSLSSEGGADKSSGLKFPETYEKGRAARRSGYSRETPKSLQYKSRQAEAEAFLRGWDDENLEQQAEQAGTV